MLLYHILHYFPSSFVLYCFFDMWMEENKKDLKKMLSDTVSIKLKSLGRRILPLDVMRILQNSHNK